MRLSVGWGLVVALLAFVAGSDSAAQGKLTEDEALTLGREAYIFGYPLVMMDVTQRVMTAVPKADGSKAPVNQFVHLRAFPDYTFTDVVSPNADTLYSIAWLDLRKEPMILSVPAMAKRYYLMQVTDAWTNVFAAPGPRTTGSGKGEFAFVGPRWTGTLPPGVKEIRSPTAMAWLIGRTQTNGTRDYTAVQPSRTSTSSCRSPPGASPRPPPPVSPSSRASMPRRRRPSRWPRWMPPPSSGG